MSRPLSMTVAAAALALAGCATPAPAPAASPTAVPAVPAPQAVAVVPDARAVVAQLVGLVPTARPGIVYDAGSDPNHLLGRPGGYLSKAAFSDTRAPTAGVAGAGSSVEVFPDPAGAAARQAYITQLGQRAAFAVEYTYVSGPVVVRVASVLTPGQAAEYERALRKITG